MKISPENKLIWADIKRWVRNILIFSSGSLIVFLTALQQGADIQTAAIALYGALINAVIDLLIKYKGEKVYK